MAETRLYRGFARNPTASDSTKDTRRIHGLESDAFVARVKEVIGDRKMTWFASECGVGESTLRNILAGAWPRTDILCAIAETGGVTLDWLATGRSPKTRAELKAALAAPAPAPSDGHMDTYRIAVEAVQAWQLEQNRFLTPDKLLQTLDLLVELSEGKPEQLKPLVGRVLRLAA